MADAQKPAASPKTNATKAVPVVAPKVFNVVGPSEYESSLVSGKLTLNRSYVKDQGSNSYKLSYTIVSSDLGSSDKVKTLELKLSKDFFEVAFLKFSADISARSASLSKFVQEKNLSLTDEKGWVDLVRYFNAL